MPDSPRVLVVEDDRRIANLLERALFKAGYRVDVAPDGDTALASAQAAAPDAVVLDVMLPGMDGLEVARRLRSRGGVPILMLTAMDAVGDRVRGLDAGADDYLVKPFAVEEFLARVRALLRRLEVNTIQRRHGPLAYKDVQVDQDARDAKRAGRPLDLRPKEFELLTYFMRNPERVVSRREIFEEVWGYDPNYLGDSNVIEVTVGQLRKELEAGGSPRLVHTVRSAGYVLRLETRDQRPETPS
jgi:two-component system response regulator MprA